MRKTRARPRGGASRAVREVKPPSDAQVAALIAEATERGPEWLAGMITVAAYTGLRLFEVAALQPEDLITPEPGEPWRVRVRRGKMGFEDEESVVFEPALELLVRAASEVPPGRLIFRTAVGTMVSRQTLAKNFAPLSAAVGFGGTFHALRHWHACWLINAGLTDLDVALQLRHHDNGEQVRRRYGRFFSRRDAFRRIASARG